MSADESSGLELVVEGPAGPAVQHAVEHLRAASSGSSGSGATASTIVAGTLADSASIRFLVEMGEIGVPEVPGSFTFGRVADSLVVAGSDEQGLMYGLLELADRVSYEGVPIDSVPPEVNSPSAALRGIFTFLHNEDCEREWFHSEEHWERYFHLLASSRFNSFNLVMAHQTNYLAPPFPFFVDVPEHPEVLVPGLTVGERRRNLESLRMVTELAGAHGLEFVLGIWEVIAWTPDSRGGHTQRSMVEALTGDNLVPYTYNATRTLLEAVPGIRGIQLRVNGESGVPRERQTDFFTDTIFKAINELDREVFLDLRGWIAEPATIEAARVLGIPMRLSMKYWAEHLGPPYQAAIQEPAYSYADFLRHPRQYPATYQVWALGSHRHFLWGDPDYVRTFAGTLSLGGASGFEISPPLAQKGFGNEPGAWRVLTEGNEHYRWEWERYWMFYILFGRISYDPETDSAPWDRLLATRFGGAALDAELAYRKTSKVVSYLIAFNMSDPNMYIWPEADTGGVLDFYMSVPPSDPARFEGIVEAARRRLAGELSARISPEQATSHLAGLGQACLDAADRLALVEREVVEVNRRELRSLLVDTRAAGNLALYHSWKGQAAYHLAIYYETGDVTCLSLASTALRSARPHWENLAALTDGYYTDKQVTGPVDSGHWKDRLTLVEEDEARLDERLDLHRRYGSGTIGGAVVAFDMGGKPQADYSYTRFPAHRDMVERGFTGVNDSALWGHPLTSDHGWELLSGSIGSVPAPLARLSDRHLDSVYRDTMGDPGYSELVPFTDTLMRDHVHGRGRARFNAAVPAGRYQTTIVFCDRSVAARPRGPFRVTIGGDAHEVPVIEPGAIYEIQVVGELSRGLVSVDFESEGPAEWFCTALIVRSMVPHLAHLSDQTSPPGSDLDVRLSVTSVAPVEKVDLVVCRPLSERISMVSDGDDLVFGATIPGSGLESGNRLEYRFEVETAEGTRAWLPAPDETSIERTYAVEIREPAAPFNPSVRHRVLVATAGEDLPIVVDVDGGPVTRAVLSYRYVNQYYRWNRVAMSIVGETITATIPGEYITSEWDLMYYLELFDASGRGVIAPGGSNILEVPYWVATVDR